MSGRERGQFPGAGREGLAVLRGARGAGLRPGALLLVEAARDLGGASRPGTGWLGGWVGGWVATNVLLRAVGTWSPWKT